MKRSARGRCRGGGRGRGRGKVEAIRDNYAVAPSSFNINPPQGPTLDQASQPKGRTLDQASLDSMGNFTSDDELPEQDQQFNKFPPEMARSLRDRVRRGGKGRGHSKIEAARDNLAVSSSSKINPPRRPMLDQAPQPQAQPNQQTNRSQREMTVPTRGRGLRGGKGCGRGKVEAKRDLIAVRSSLNIDPPQGATSDQSSQPQGPTLDQEFLDLMGHFIDNLPEPDQQIDKPQPETTRLRGRARSSQFQSQDQPTRIAEILSSPETSQGSYSGSRLLRNLDGSIPSSENLNNDAVSCRNTRKGRGKYRSLKVDKKTRFGNKIIVHIPDDINRAVGPEARDIVNYCGLVMRSTISFRDGDCKWSKIFANQGEEMLLKVKEKFEVGGGKGEHVLQDFVNRTMQKLFGTHKTRLHAEYSRYSTDEERLSHLPGDVTPDDWKFLVQYFGSEAFKARSERNKINRQKQISKHTCGSKSFAEVEESMRDPNTGEKAPPDLIWKLQHTYKNDKGELVWSDPQAQQIHDQIKELVAQQEYEPIGNRISGDEILATVLGDRTGYVRGKGYGKKPRKKSYLNQQDYESSLSSAIESARQEMQADMDQKLQEECEKMRAEIDKRFEEQMEEERRKMQAEMDQKVQQQMEEERRKMQAEMDKRMIDNMATLMLKMQQYQAQSSSTPLVTQPYVTQPEKQNGTQVSWASKRKRKW